MECSPIDLSLSLSLPTIKVLSNKFLWLHFLEYFESSNPCPYHFISLCSNCHSRTPAHSQFSCSCSLFNSCFTNQIYWSLIFFPFFHNCIMLFGCQGVSSTCGQSLKISQSLCHNLFNGVGRWYRKGGAIEGVLKKWCNLGFIYG